MEPVAASRPPGPRKGGRHGRISWPIGRPASLVAAPSVGGPILRLVDDRRGGAGVFAIVDGVV